MNFDLTDERRMVQDSLRRLLADTVTPDRIAAATESALGYDADLWTALADMGAIGATLPEDAGGFGGAGFDLAVVFEEIGRAGAVTPLIESGVQAAGLLADLGDAAQRARAEEAAGGKVFAVAHAEPAARYTLGHVETRAVRDGDGWRIDGRKAVVGFASAAEAILVTARTDHGPSDSDGISIFLVPHDTEGLSLRDYPLQGGGRAAELALDGVHVGGEALIGPEGGAYQGLEQANARAICALCAEALGLMETCRALTVAYLKERRQFGQPLGKFQALQHRMADMLIEIEQARSAVINLAGHLESDRANRERHVSATKNLIGRAGKLVVEEAFQMHGAIGLSQDYALGHFAKRLAMVDHRFGDADHHLERFIRLSGE
ncbi:alkylation response protein AidB-like acyl-CoA dehydrogenase [Roseovarius sp. MBR-78]|uniref:acyl-CoA dehydrogenase family protein n=1 Tax=Roseovarius sp. MBR-78 TaxID=3156460 RepID=UPI00339AB7EB